MSRLLPLFFILALIAQFSTVFTCIKPNTMCDPILMYKGDDYRCCEPHVCALGRCLKLRRG
nr:venom polypeptide precursor [Doratifera vulnerans]